MTKFSLLFSDLSHTPIHYLFGKLANKFGHFLLLYRERKKYRNNPSYKIQPDIGLNHIFNFQSLDFKSTKFEKDLLENYLEHRFDILGSGWVRWSYSSLPLGFYGNKYENEKLNIDPAGNWLEKKVNTTNLKYAKLVWEEVININPKYMPICWQRDIKTGFSYNSKEHFSKLNLIRPEPGVDVKVPWELSRLQHLPELVAFSQVFNNREKEIINEVICQVLDFIASNPPGYGVNWSSAMESSIRLLNMAVIFEAISQTGLLDPENKIYNIILSSISDHIDFGWKYREYKGGVTNNHYLANLCGLLFGSYLLSSQSKYRTLFEKVANKFLTEVDKQFLDDGGNFESSTTYHIFSSEISVLGLSILKRARNENLIAVDIDEFEKVECKLMHAFKIIEDLRFPDGSFPQFGDNDSARMIFWNNSYRSISNTEAESKYENLNGYVNLLGEGLYFDREPLTYNTTLNICRAYFGSTESNDLNHQFIKSILNKTGNSYSLKENKREYRVSAPIPNFTNSNVYKIELQTKIRSEKPVLSVYPDFGVYIYKNSSFSLIINGMNRHVKQYWPHGHNDKLAFDLWYLDKPIFRDPGSFIYTACPEQRNKYRSVTAHNTVIFENQEQNRWIPGVSGIFRTKPETNVKLLSIDNQQICLMCEYRKFKHIRIWEILEDAVVIKDQANHPFSVNKNPRISFSPGYGRILRE